MFKGYRGGSGGGGGGGGDGKAFAVQSLNNAGSPYTVSLSSTKSDMLSVDVSGGSVTVNIPSPTPIAGKMVIVKDALGQAASNNITVSTTGSIDGSSSVTINNNGASLLLVSDGIRWTVN